MKLVTVREKFLKKNVQFVEEKVRPDRIRISLLKFRQGLMMARQFVCAIAAKQLLVVVEVICMSTFALRRIKNSLVKVILFLAKNIFLWLMRHWERRLMWKLWTA